MARALESRRYTNPELEAAFSPASKEAGIVLPDGNGLVIVGKSDKSTWSNNPSSFETDDKSKETGPYANKWVLWLPSVDLPGDWSMLPEDEESALNHIAGGLLRPFARAANSAVRGSTKISKDFQSHREGLALRLARGIADPGFYVSLESEAVGLVLASLPEEYHTDDTIDRLAKRGAVFLGQVIDLGESACKTLLESDR